MSEAVVALFGFCAGAACLLVVLLWWRRREAADARRVIEEDRQALQAQLKTAFAALSQEALSRSIDDFLKLAGERLDRQTVQGEKALEEKKKLIDARLEEMGTRLTTLNSLIQSIETQRAEAYGSLKSHLEKSTQISHRLHETTAQLREALANPQRRGQWGERMAEDVLRVAGFLEGVNYVKQRQVADGSRPDFTFLLPDERRVHMDVKFPLVNYLKMLDASDDASREASAAQFLKDVRSRIREVTTRNYIDPAGGTVDYVLVFIPNEQVYSYIHERDHALLDDALRSKVVLCAPMTLYAILAVIRQAADNFRLEQHSRQILDLLAEFKKQWGKYVEGMETMGKRLDAAVGEYQQLVGVRSRQLDRQMERIEDLRAAGVEEPQLIPGQRSA